MAMLLFLIIAFVSGEPIPPPPRKPDCPSILCRKIIYYSPSVIGEDPHVGKIDVYTSYFTNLHERDLPVIQRLGATHILVSDNWAADGTTAHYSFLKLLNDTHEDPNKGPPVKLIVTFPIPTTNEDMTQKDYQVLRDRSKQAFLKLMEEFSDGGWGEVLDGYNIPAAPAEKLSTKELGMYYGVVNDLRALQESVKDKSPLHNLMVGFPVESQNGKTATGFDFKSVKATFFTINIYTKDDRLIKTILQDYTKAAGTIPIIPILQTDNYNQTNRTSDDQKQVDDLKAMFSVVQTQTKAHKPQGMIIMEFSDEWWRADLSTAGYNVEGCPNGNAYAHTSCGINIPKGDILSLEYMGMFEIRDIPFSFCIVKKPVVQYLQELWIFNGDKKGESLDKWQIDNVSCTTINFIIHWYGLAPLAGVSIIFLILILIIPPPSVPQKPQPIELRQM